MQHRLNDLIQERSDMIEIEFKAKVWRYPGASGWHFVTLPKKQSAGIKSLFKDQARPWGSLKVSAFVGESEWSTSLFPDTKRGAYLLPLKASVRKKEKILADKMVVVKLRLEV